MKKILFMVILAVLLSVLPASADLIWGWDEKDVFANCKDTGSRSYIAAGEKGWITSGTPWGDQSPANSYLNGTEFITDKICEYEGKEWLSIRILRYPQPDSMDFRSGHIGEMVLLEDVVPAYDTDAFMKDHAAEIQKDDESIDVCEFVPFTIWRYPNSGIRLYEITTKDECRPFQRENSDLVSEGFRYTDPDGDRWELFSDETIFNRVWVNIDHPYTYVDHSGMPENEKLSDLLEFVN